MSERAQKHCWVEIHTILLEPGKRAPQVPEDTQRVPLEMRVKGYLTAGATLGEDAEILTTTGRRLRGTLVAINPGYSHGFGAPIAELQSVGSEMRQRLSGQQTGGDTDCE
jgi:hypothetical protein